MKTEQELRAQAQQQFQDYMQKKQQESGRELSDDDLEKVAGGESIVKLMSMYSNYYHNCTNSGNQPLSYNDWLSSNGYTM